MIQNKMFNKKEIAWIIFVIIIFEFIIFLKMDEKLNLVLDISKPQVLIVPIVIILVNLIAKKIAASFYSMKIEFSIWKFQRWSYYSRSHFKKPFPIGLVFSFFLAFFTLGFVKPMAFLQFDAKNLPLKRLLKRQGRMRKTDINEADLAFTSLWGLYSLIIVSAIGTILSFRELAIYPIYYAFWNLVPFGNLDGTKLFLGSVFNWALAIVVFIITLAISLMFFY